MLCIKLHRIFMADAEDVMAEIWNCLEGYDIPSPAMTFTFEGQQHVTMQIRFDEPLWAELVNRCVCRWRAERAAAASAAQADGVHSPEQFILSESAGHRPQRGQKVASYWQPTIARAR